MSDPVTTETERWLLKRGLPHFIADYSPSRDVLTRAVPVFTLIFLFEVANAPKRDFPIWLDIVALAVGLGILLGAWMVANRIRGQALLTRPKSIGVFEVSVFVLAPPAIPLLFGGQWRSALATGIGNVLLLAVIFFGTSYGVADHPVGRSSNRSGGRAGDEPARARVAVADPLHLIGVGFSVIRLPREIGELSDFESWDVVVGRVDGTPASALVDEATRDQRADTPPLSRRQWGNVAPVFLFSQALQVVLVSVMVFVFLFVCGVLVVTEPVALGFIDAQPNLLASFELWGRDLVVTQELLRVTGFLTVFAGLYFSVTAITDESYRREFIGEILEEMRRSLAVRAVYLAARNARAIAAAG